MAKAFTDSYVQNILQPFAGEAGVHFPKLCTDIGAFLQQWSQTIVTEEGDWKASTKGRVVSKSGHTLQLPVNSPLTALYQFALRIDELAKAGSQDKPLHRFVLEANFPATVEPWFSTTYRKSPKAETVKENAAK